MASEKTYLISSGFYRSSFSSARSRGRAYRAAASVGRGVKSVLGLQKDGKQGEFSSSIGVILSMLGCVVGTGNIWRFPRIVALHSDGGALAFIIVWILFLMFWSIPVILISYGVGRYTNKSVVESFAKLIGPSYRWMGGFIFVLSFGIASYYSVLVGYCAYYMVYFWFTPLPDSVEVSNEAFDTLLDSHWPLVIHLIMTILASLCISRGVSTIEPVSRIIVPLLLIILVFTFYWSLYLPYAGMGIIHMFTPNWTALGNSELWRDALTQNAWDTGAGGGATLTYATYMSRNQGAVKIGSTNPILNNIVSLLCGITIFCSVFSSGYLKGSSTASIVSTLKSNGPFNTGITFIQMPLLYHDMTGGRYIAILFFICVTLAGFSSLISLFEVCVHVLEDYGIRRIPAVVVVFLLISGLGVGSALSPDMFANQDAVWGQALIVSGCFLIFMVIRHGILKFRRDLYNNYGINDWPLPLIWVAMILIIAPLEGLGMLVWWIVDQVINNSDPYVPNSPWWQYTPTSLIMVVSQWTLALCILIGLNWWMKPVTKVTIELKSDRPKKLSRKFLDRLSYYLIRYEPLKLAPRYDLIDETTPTSSAADEEEYLMAETKKYEDTETKIADIKL